MNIQDAVQAMESVVRFYTDPSAQILDAVEAVLAAREAEIKRAVVEIAKTLARYLEEEFGPWQNANR